MERENINNMSPDTNNKLKIGMIGCGNMGSALVENLKKNRVVENLFVLDKENSKTEALAKGFGAVVCKDIEDIKEKSQILIIAVKPQDIDTILGPLKHLRDKLIISIAAGITLDFLESILGKDVMVVRAMPNLNALIAKSVTAICANKSAGRVGLEQAKQIFSSIGEVVIVDDSKMNAVTAISGSGPAFVAYLYPDLSLNEIESVMEEEADNFGIEIAKAKVLASVTTQGTLAMIKGNLDPGMLIKRVSSKGGTTEAGMNILTKSKKNKDALRLAIKAAEKRAHELARRGTNLWR